MATTIEYALLAGEAYQDTRAAINRFPIPNEWVVYSRVPESSTSGFEASAYQRGTEIVISFAGTGTAIDHITNVALALGDNAEQLLQAAAYYLQVKASAPAGATITFTGHSLGGGLASLVAVFFGVGAQTFDQAPFQNSASEAMRDYLVIELTRQGFSATDLAPLSGYSAADYALRSGSVTNINVQGEVLSSAPFTLFNRIGTTIQDIANSANGVAGGDLHSQALLTAMLQSGDTSTTTATDHTLGQVTFKLTDLLKMIFDKNLFARDTDPLSDQVNLIEHLVRHQAGGIGGVPAGGDQMVTRFTSDLWKLAQDGGLTMSEGATLLGELNNVNKALIAFAMQKYYEENNPNITYGTELFTDLSTAGTGNNGIQFDMADVSAKFKTAFDTNQALTLSDAKGNAYFQQYLHTGLDFTAQEQALLTSLLPYMRDWYVQAGMNGMTATDTLGRNAFIPYSLTLAEDKNLFEVLGGSANDAEWRIAA